MPGLGPVVGESLGPRHPWSNGSRLMLVGSEGVVSDTNLPGALLPS